jgi:dihydroneopterin aldolase
MRRGTAPTVIKIGGSAAFSPDLRRWAATVAACGGRAVVVPGGGPFADVVRAAQPRMEFDDTTAHHMALLAMEQFGRALASFDARLSPVDSIAAVRRAVRDKRVPVWLPTRLALAATDIPASWEVTSDCLAAWLAGKLSAARLVLLKQIEPPPDVVSVAELAAKGIVDPAFPRFLKQSGVPALILGPPDHMAVAATLCDHPPIGSPIVLH